MTTRIILLLVIAIDCVAQVNNTDYLHNRAVLERLNSNSYGLTNSTIPSLPMAPPGISGNVYLTKYYNSTVFQLYDSDKYMEGYLSKLDLQRNEFDLRTPKGVMVLKGSQVKSFAFIDSITNERCSFINGKEFITKDKVPLVGGFYQIISDGKVPLLLRSEIILKKATYNPTLDVGNKNHQYIKKEQFFYLNGNTVAPLPKKKFLFEIFGDAKPKISTFAETNALDLSKRRDLIRLFDHYNTTEEVH
jgi:hypothetical protein